MPTSTIVAEKLSAVRELFWGPWYYRWLYKRQLDGYLQQQPRIRAQMGLEVDRPPGSQYGVWQYYDHWPESWKERLLTFFIAYARDSDLPLADPLPLSDTVISNFLIYRSVELARDVYFAQVAHVLWLEMSRRLPWRLADWSDHELSYLVSSKVCFAAQRSFPANDLYYVVSVSSRSDATENILHDPRIPYRFMTQEPEQARSLFGATPGETGQKLSGWFHDYLWHNPGGSFSSQEFHRNYPLLEDRLRRHTVEPLGSVYLTSAGCGSASSLFADLMRSVNIPVRKVNNIIMSFSNEEERHSGLIFDWQGGSGQGRYLLHTDDLYSSSYFKDPAPAPKDTERGAALWNHVWLDPSAFGRAFSYEVAPDIFGKATSEQKVKYWNMGDWLASSANAIRAARSLDGQEGVVGFLERERGFSASEALACWHAVEASVLAYGDGDMNQGFQRLLDGPDSRHARWCRRTGKCEGP